VAGDNGIDLDVKTFILEKVESVEHVEILLLLHAHPERDWSADEISQTLRNSRESANLRLSDLAGKGILRPSASDSTRYRYAPRDHKLAETVDKLVTTYSERRVSVINLIFSKPLERIQVFADAFKIRKD